VVVVVMACGRPAQERICRPADPQVAASLDRGVEWLLAEAKIMPSRFVLSFIRRLARIATGCPVGERARVEVERALQIPIASVPEAWDRALLENHLALGEITAELGRRKQAGTLDPEDVAGLAAAVREHEQAMFRSRAKVGPRVTTQYRLAKLGIQTRTPRRDLVAPLYERWLSEDQDELLLDKRFVYAVTHVILTASGYFSRHLDSADFAMEKEILERARDRYLGEGMLDRVQFVDLSGEVLFSLKLLRVPENEAARRLRTLLIGRQKKDGSWGENAEHRIHATAVLSFALFPFPDRLPDDE
jgi:hypothetical protein